MKSQSFAAIFMLFVVSAAAQDSAAPQNVGIQCPVSTSTLAKFENDSLAVTVLPSFVFRPGGPGFVDADGALGMKLGWQRKRPGQLEISGKRLDAQAPPARAYINDRDELGHQPTYLVFPTAGCWEITGQIPRGFLKFVTFVEKIGDGPERRFEGLQSGERVSGGLR